MLCIYRWAETPTDRTKSCFDCNHPGLSGTSLLPVFVEALKLKLKPPSSQRQAPPAMADMFWRKALWTEMDRYHRQLQRNLVILTGIKKTLQTILWLALHTQVQGEGSAWNYCAGAENAELFAVLKGHRSNVSHLHHSKINVLSNQLCESCWHRITCWGRHIHHLIYTRPVMVCTKIIRSSDPCPLYPHFILHK